MKKLNTKMLWMFSSSWDSTRGGRMSPSQQSHDVCWLSFARRVLLPLISAPVLWKHNDINGLVSTQPKTHKRQDELSKVMSWSGRELWTQLLLKACRAKIRLSTSIYTERNKSSGCLRHLHCPLCLSFHLGFGHKTYLWLTWVITGI